MVYQLAWPQPNFYLASIASLDQGCYCIRLMCVCLSVWPRIVYLLWINHWQASNHKTSLAKYYTFTLDNLRQFSNGHLSMQPLLLRHLSISAISQMLLTRFWPNFKVSFLGPSLTDVTCQDDICPDNIWLGDICPFQQNLIC